MQRAPPLPSAAAGSSFAALATAVFRVFVAAAMVLAAVATVPIVDAAAAPAVVAPVLTAAATIVGGEGQS